MHDLKSIRDNPDGFDAGLQRRGLPLRSAEILGLDTRRRAAQTAFQELQARRNEVSKQIGQLKKSGGDASALMDEVASLKERIPAVEEEVAGGLADEGALGADGLGMATGAGNDGDSTAEEGFDLNTELDTTAHTYI